jgi:hypothetical protein
MVTYERGQGVEVWVRWGVGRQTGLGIPIWGGEGKMNVDCGRRGKEGGTRIK